MGPNMNTTSHQTSLLAKPQNDEPISKRTLGYVSEMAREEVFDLVATACVEAGVTRGQLSKRLAKDPAQVSRLLAAPGNWTIDTIAEFLFAIDGSMLRAARFSPLEQHVANFRHSNCLEAANTVISMAQNRAAMVAPVTAGAGSSAIVTGANRW